MGEGSKDGVLPSIGVRGGRGSAREVWVWPVGKKGTAYKVYLPNETENGPWRLAWTCETRQTDGPTDKR